MFGKLLLLTKQTITVGKKITSQTQWANLLTGNRFKQNSHIKMKRREWLILPWSSLITYDLIGS